MFNHLSWLSVAIISVLGTTDSKTRDNVPVAVPVAATPIVFDGVTVIDVEHGRRILDQRVVIVGTHITTVGRASDVRLPTGAQVIDARGKYLIPGLWDIHTHLAVAPDFFYPLFIANGVTGFRDAGSPVPLATQRSWRQEILTGTRIGPPRQILSGPQLDDTAPGRAHAIAVPDVASARRVVDSLQAAGADMIKTYNLNKPIYLAIAAEARRVHIPFGGHLGEHRFATDALGLAMRAMGIPVSDSGTASPMGPNGWGPHGLQGSASAASESGASIIDHSNSASGDLGQLCWDPQASVASCQPLATQFQRNGTWAAPTLVSLIWQKVDAAQSGGMVLDNTQFAPASFAIIRQLRRADSVFRISGQLPPHWLQHGAPTTTGLLSIAHQVGLPLLAGTDVEDKAIDNGQALLLLPGISLHTELALEVAEGLTPLEALQAATLNPARMFHATDSLGTVASGKLADLVLLDADPLTDITNTTEIRAVVANGRYFDRMDLDQLLQTAWTAPHAFWRQR